MRSTFTFTFCSLRPAIEHLPRLTSFLPPLLRCNGVTRAPSPKFFSTLPLFHDTSLRPRRPLSQQELNLFTCFLFPWLPSVAGRNVVGFLSSTFSLPVTFCSL